MNLRQKRLIYGVESLAGLIGEFVLYGSLIGVTSYFIKKVCKEGVICII